MPQHKQQFIVEVFGPTGTSYGYVKSMLYSRGRYQTTRNVPFAKKYTTFDQAAYDIDLLVRYDITLRCQVTQIA